MNQTDATMIEQTHRTQAQAITREPHIDTRPIFRELCRRCSGTGWIDRYSGQNGMDYSSVQCSCDRGWREVYAPLPPPTTKEKTECPTI